MSFEDGIRIIDENTSFKRVNITIRNKRRVVSVECGNGREIGFSRSVIEELVRCGWTFNAEFQCAFYVEERNVN